MKKRNRKLLRQIKNEKRKIEKKLRMLSELNFIPKAVCDYLEYVCTVLGDTSILEDIPSLTRYCAWREFLLRK